MKIFSVPSGMITVCFCILISLNAKAQEITFTPSHLKAAEDLIMLMHVPGMLKSLAKMELKNSIEMEKDYHIRPELHEKFINTMKAYFEKYGNWELVKNDIINVYAAEFSEPEIKELTKFYGTPLGQKLLKKQPMLTEKNMEIGRKALNSHQEELMKDMIKFEAEKN